VLNSGQKKQNKGSGYQQNNYTSGNPVKPKQNIYTEQVSKPADDSGY
jgi:hypothetical protein